MEVISFLIVFVSFTVVRIVMLHETNIKIVLPETLYVRNGFICLMLTSVDIVLENRSI